MSEHKLRCGDVVRHIPTDEKWVVAYADYETGDMSWGGWPEGRARIADCELVRVASDEVHRDWVERFTSMSDKRDHRFRAVDRLYGGQSHD